MRCADSNLTLPSIRLNRVKSRPLPTFWCSTQRAPRWRMMMPPARTDWPSLTFTPSRLDSESRPLEEEPPPFLCAIGRRIIGTLPDEVKPKRGGRRPPPVVFDPVADHLRGRVGPEIRAGRNRRPES